MSFIVRTASILFVITAFEYLFGFFRSLLIAKYFGVTGITDSYFFVCGSLLFVASVFSNSVKSSFIPVFMEAKQSDGEKAAWDFAMSFLVLCIVIVSIILLFSVIFAWLIQGISQAGNKSSKFR